MAQDGAVLLQKSYEILDKFALSNLCVSKNQGKGTKAMRLVSRKPKAEGCTPAEPLQPRLPPSLHQ